MFLNSSQMLITKYTATSRQRGHFIEETTTKMALWHGIGNQGALAEFATKGVMITSWKAFLKRQGL